MKKKWTVNAVLDKCVDVTGGVIFAMMVFCEGFNVVSWWVRHRRYGQLEELVTAGLVWIVFLAIGIHYRKNSTVKVDFLLNAMPAEKRKKVDVVTDILSFIIATVTLYFATKLMLKSTNKVTNVLKICYVWIDLGVVLGYISLLYNIIYKYYCVLFKKNEPEQIEDAGGREVS